MTILKQKEVVLLRDEQNIGHIWAGAVTMCLLYHGTFLFSYLRRTHLLFGMFSYDWIHSLVLLSSLNSSFIEL